MKLNYKILDDIILFENNAIIRFDFPIKQIIENEIILLVLLDVQGKRYNQNVFAINENAEIIWQIEKSENLEIIGNCSFTSFEIKNSELSLYNFCGFRFSVNLNTGKVIRQVFTK